MIYFTSDTHYNHKNIVRGTSEWKEVEDGSSHQKTRNFNTLEEHNYALVKVINDRVKPLDTLWHLGDWSFGGFESIKKFRDQLNCQDINLVYGNHDHHIEQNKDHIQDLFRSVQHYKELSINGHKVCLFHYAARVWNKSHRGSIFLFGHSHATLKGYEKYKTMDVGVDTNPTLSPYSWTEIQSIMSNRLPLIGLDHHTKNTN